MGMNASQARKFLQVLHNSYWLALEDVTGTNAHKSGNVELVERLSPLLEKLPLVWHPSSSFPIIDFDKLFNPSPLGIATLLLASIRLRDFDHRDLSVWFFSAYSNAFEG